MRGRARAFAPATPLGVMELLKRSGLEVAGRSAVVLGDSNVSAPGPRTGPIPRLWVRETSRSCM